MIRPQEAASRYLSAPVAWDPRTMDEGEATARRETGGPAWRQVFTPAFLFLSGFYFFVFFAGYQLFPILPLHLRDLGAGLAESGRFMTAFTLGAAFGGLFTGPLGDRLGPRRVLALASLLMALFLGGYAFLPVRWGFPLLAPLNGVVWSGLRTAAVTKAGTLLPLEHRAEGLSFFGLSSPAGIALGPLLGLALWPVLGFRAILLGLAASFVLLHVATRWLPADAPPERPEGPEAGPRGLGRALLLPAGIAASLGISYGAIPPFAAQEARLLGMAWPSALLACLAGGIVGIRFLLGLRGLGARPVRLLPWSLALTACGQLVLALAPGGTLRHLLGGLLYGGGYGISHTLLFMHILDTARAGRRGAGIGALYFAYDAGQALGATLVGQVMDTAGRALGPGLGFRTGWLVAALVILGAVELGRRVARPEEAPA